MKPRIYIALLVIGGLCGGLLVVSNALTRPLIDANRAAEDRALIENMLAFPLGAEIDLYAERFGDCDRFEAMRIQTDGYAASIELLVVRHLGTDTAALRVLRHLETPGIGDFIDHRKDAWITQLDGLSRHDIVGFDGVSGATVTTQAVRRGLTIALTNMAERPLNCIPPSDDAEANP